MALSVDIRKALGNFHLAVQFDAGDETLALLGASGCGKSVTLKCIAGILTPDEGHIELDGVTLYDSASRINLPPQRRQVGYLFQQYALFPNMTVRQNIAAAVRDKARRQTEVAEKLRQFRLEAVADQKPGQLSGGQQQRCALARILASEPTAILLDEPFSALDSYLKYQLELELAETLGGFPGTVLWVSHDRGEVFRNCRRVCVIDRGRSQPVTTLGELFRSPGTEAAARLSGCKNYADARPREDAVFLPDWGLTLSCGRPVPGGRLPDRHPGPPCSAGRSRGGKRLLLHGSKGGGGRVFHHRALRPEGAAAGRRPCCGWSWTKDNWQAVPDKDRLTVSVPPEAILLLES